MPVRGGEVLRAELGVTALRRCMGNGGATVAMTREEIGSYLGLKLETVSRAFSRFQDEGLISVQQKHVRILDLPRLKSLLAPPDGRIA